MGRNIKSETFLRADMAAIINGVEAALQAKYEVLAPQIQTAEGAEIWRLYQAGEETAIEAMRIAFGIEG